MGYYTNYEVKVEVPQFIQTLDTAVVYHEIDKYTGGNYDSIKWYDHEADLKAVSIKFPLALITIDGAGEEQGDIWRKYFLGGKMAHHSPQSWTPPPFDLKDLV